VLSTLCSRACFRSCARFVSILSTAWSWFVSAPPETIRQVNGAAIRAQPRELVNRRQQREQSQVTGRTLLPPLPPVPILFHSFRFHVTVRNSLSRHVLRINVYGLFPLVRTFCFHFVHGLRTFCFRFVPALRTPCFRLFSTCSRPVAAHGVCLLRCAASAGADFVEPRPRTNSGETLWRSLAIRQSDAPCRCARLALLLFNQKSGLKSRCQNEPVVIFDAMGVGVHRALALAA